MSNLDHEVVQERFDRYGEQATSAIIARIPDVRPAFESLVVDDLGYLWVAQMSATQQDVSFRDVTFDVFDPEGRFPGVVEVDVGRYPPPRITGDHLVGVMRDEFDTPGVVVYRIEGREGFDRTPTMIASSAEQRARGAPQSSFF